MDNELDGRWEASRFPVLQSLSSTYRLLHFHSIPFISRTLGDSKSPAPEDSHKDEL